MSNQKTRNAKTGKKRPTSTGAKHLDGSYVTVSKRKDGRWSGYYYDYTFSPDGKPVRGERHNLCLNDRERLIAKIVEKETPKVLTFREVANEWQREKWETLAHNSIASYTPALRRLVDQFGDSPLDQLETTDITAYLNSLAAQGYARRTVQLHRDIAAMVYEYAIQRGLLKYSPVDHAAMPKNLPKTERELPPEEALKAVREGLNKPFGLFAYLCYYAGLRRGEALALRYEDIDRKEGVIHVTKSVEFLGNSPHTKAPKTKNSVRNVVLLDVLADAVPLGIGYIFSRDDKPGEPLRQSDFKSQWGAYCKAIGFKITPHQLRHGYATMLYEANVGPKEAQKLLGHANVQITLDVYTHISEQLKSRAAEQLNDFIRKQYGDGDSDGKSVRNA